MPKTTKTVEQTLSDLDARIEGARLREQAARLQREKLENQRRQVMHRAGKADDAVAVTVDDDVS